jgi:hypothetical protein
MIFLTTIMKKKLRVVIPFTMKIESNMEFSQGGYACISKRKVPVSGIILQGEHKHFY